MSIDSFLRDVLILLAAATVVVLLSHRLRIPPVVGFLLSGVAIGPAGLGWVGDRHDVEIFAEIGVIFLLFTVGLELSLERLREIRRAVVLGGSLQVAVTATGAFLLARAAGLAARQAIFLAFLVTLSSTAVVLKLYADRQELDAPHGKLALGILIFQDLLLVPLIVLTRALGGAGEAAPAALALRLAITFAGAALVFALARFLLPRLLFQLAKTQVREILLFGALVSCLGLAWLTARLELSLALGAFLAGVIFADSDLHHQIAAEVGPFRALFNSIFFVSAGMLLDLAFAAHHLPQVLGLAALILVGKAAATGLAVAVLRYPRRTRILTGLGLAQVGEFAFVLLAVGQGYHLLDGALYQTLLAAAVLTIMLTPSLVALAPRLADLGRRGGTPNAEPRPADRGGHVIIVGFGTNGKNLARVLREAAIPYRVIELAVEIARRAQSEGEPVLFGDATRPEILEQARLSAARVLVVATSDPLAAARVVRHARQKNPTLHILVRTRRVAEVEALRRAGANEVLAEEFETSIEIFSRVLARFHVPGNVIRAQARALRGEDYLLLRRQSLAGNLPEGLVAALAAGTTEVYRLAPESSAVGRTIGELDLRRSTGATILAVVRGERPALSPGPDTELAAGDCLVLVGSHAEIDRAFQLLDAAEGPA